MTTRNLTRRKFESIPGLARRIAVGFTLALCSLGGPVLAAQPAVTEAVSGAPRESASVGFLQSDASNPVAQQQRQFSYAPLLAGIPGSGSEGRRGTRKSGTPSALIAQAVNVDFWIYDAWVELSYDQDRDGYYTDFRLTFDTDTYYSVADVFAVVYLSYEGGPWNEFAYTYDFTIYADSPDDVYVIETTLASGYPTGDYDLLIEIYDAYTGYLVADLGPEWADLAYLPLEDIQYDTPVSAPPEVILVEGGGGSMDWLLLGALALVTVGRRRFNYQLKVPTTPARAMG